MAPPTTKRRKTATQKAVERLSEDICTGRYLPHRLFPTEMALCERFGLSRMTIRSVLSRLEQKGLIYRHQGRGTFVCPLDQVRVKPIVLLLREFQKSTGPYITEIIHGANACLNAVGTHVMIKSDSPREWTAEFTQSIGGVIVIPTQLYPEDIDALTRANLAYLIIMESDLSGPTVRMSPKEAAGELTRGLLKLGHRRFALLSGQEEHTDRQKRQGIFAALAEAGIDPAGVPDYRTNYDPDLAKAAAAEMMHLSDRPTAVIAFDDTLAVIAMSAARQAGLAVPTDVSVMGFNDASFSSLVDPPLSTVRFPILQAGNAASKSLCENYLNGGNPGDIELGHEIIWRSSTGPAT